MDCFGNFPFGECDEAICEYLCLDICACKRTTIERERPKPKSKESEYCIFGCIGALLILGTISIIVYLIFSIAGV